MPSRSYDFVGRYEEIALINSLVSDFGKRHICLIQGEGGVGKTRLLQELYKDITCIKTAKLQPILSTRIIDLSETALRIPLNLEYVIGSQINQDGFQRLNTIRDDYISMQLKDVSQTTLERQLDFGYTTFIEEYNIFSKNNRCMLLLDTVDSQVIGSELLSHFLDRVIPHLENTLFVMAGRECVKIKPLLSDISETSVQLIELKGFNIQEAKEYFGETLTGQNITPDLQSKIVFLSRGKPIIISLAIAWLERDVPLPQLDQLSIEELQQLSKEKMDEIHRQFEDALVGQLLALDEKTSLLIMEMAHLERRFDAKLLAYMENITILESKNLIEELSRFPFVKQMPGEVHLLHDEMRRLVQDKVWPRIDPLGTQRRMLSQQAVDFYNHELEALEEDIKRLNLDVQESQTHGKVLNALETARLLWSLQRDKWTLSAERLFYALKASPEKGAKQFQEEFTRATAGFLLNYSDLLVGEMLPFLPTIPDELQFDITLQISSYLRSVGQLDLAIKLMNTLNKKFIHNNYYEAQILKVQATCERDTGHSEAGLLKLKKALNICEQNKLEKLIPEIENQIGILHKDLGNLDLAIETFQSALKHLETKTQRDLQASIMDNLGSAYSLLGNHDQAVAYCQFAIEIRKALGQIRSVAMSHATLGSIYRHQDKFDQSYYHYQQAIDTFDTNDDKVWISTVLMDRGVQKAGQFEVSWYGLEERSEAEYDRFKHLLYEARDDLEKSIKISQVYNKRQLPRAIHELGHIYWELLDFDKTEKTWLESLESARESHDGILVLENLTALAELDYDRKLYTKFFKDYETLAPYDTETSRRDHYWLWARITKLAGHAHFALGNYDVSLKNYCEAYPQIARYKGWGRYRFELELDALGERIDSLPTEMALAWCKTLREGWASSNLPVPAWQTLDLFLEAREIKAETLSSRSQIG